MLSHRKQTKRLVVTTADPHKGLPLGAGPSGQLWQYKSGTAIWTAEEEKMLLKAEEKFPRENIDSSSRVILIASELGTKSARDVAHKIYWREYDAMEKMAHSVASSTLLAASAAQMSSTTVSNHNNVDTLSSTAIRNNNIETSPSLVNGNSNSSNEYSDLCIAQANIEIAIRNNMDLLVSMRNNLGEGHLEQNLSKMEAFQKNAQLVQEQINNLGVRIPQISIDMSLVNTKTKKRKRKTKTHVL